MPSQIIIDSTVFCVTVDLRIGPSWHIYAPTGRNSSQGMIETNITYQLPKGIAKKGKLQIPPAHYKSGYEVLEGEIKFTQQFVLSKEFKPGQYFILAKIEYQACNETRCLPPITNEEKIVILIK